jgi:hypothetical protein
MTVFDLLFLGAVFASLVALVAAAAAFIRRRRARGISILRTLVVCVAGYLAVVVVAGYLSPQRVLKIGEPWCFDDWCLSVEGVSRTPAASAFDYKVTFRIFSRALRVAQRARGAWIYLIDDRGHQYASRPGPGDVPLDVLLEPSESVTTSRDFRVPQSARGLGLITGHGGPISKFIIGDEASLFHKRTFVRLTYAKPDERVRRGSGDPPH